VLGKVSNTRRTLVIGEDLGTVPEGFSDMTRAAEMMSCVVLYFEQGRDSFAAAEDYPARAFVSASTHDLPPLAAWWSGDDIALLAEIGQIDDGEAGRRRDSRRKDRAALLARLRDPSSPSRTAAAPARMTPSLAAEIHRFLARTPSRLLGIQMGDLCGLTEPVNLPGTVDEYPNWRRRLPVTVEELRRGEFYAAIIAAVAAERPKPC
jgi:4-alpha-glucanotransferase